MNQNSYKTRIRGIPALIKIISFDPGRPGYYCGHPDYNYPEDPPEIEYEICDISGRYANWLERKLTETTRHELEGQLINWLIKQREESLHDYP